MAKYKLHTNLRISSIEYLLGLWNSVLADKDERITLDFTNVFYLTPFSMCLFSALRDELYERHGKTMFFKYPKETRVKRQLERMRNNEDKPEYNGTSYLIPTLGVTRLPNDLDIVNRRKLRDIIYRFINIQIILPKQISYLFHFALKEVIDNSFTHGDSNFGCYVCANGIPQKKLVRVCFLDRGIGIKDSLINKYPNITNSEVAIRESLKKKVTSTDDPDRGVGLYILKDSIERNKGDMTILSSDGKYEYLNKIRKNLPVIVEISKTQKYFFPGTIVNLVIRSDPKFIFLEDSIEEVF